MRCWLIVLIKPHYIPNWNNNSNLIMSICKIVALKLIHSIMKQFFYRPRVLPVALHVLNTRQVTRLGIKLVELHLLLFNIHDL